MANDVDFVFPFVDCSDIVWQKAYKETRNKLNLPTKIKQERFRKWDNLKYVFRGIDRNMPWIRKIHMIVSNPEQVPQWVNQDTTHIVLHKDIIPEEFLPTFNSSTIECFINKIPDLSDNFIYGNDDTFIINKSDKSDWFEDGVPKIKMKSDSRLDTMFKRMEYREQKVLADYFGIKLLNPEQFIFKPEHTISPFNKKELDKILDIFGDLLYNSCTEFRKEKNINQYFYTYYMYFNGSFKLSNREYIYRTAFSNNIKNKAEIIKKDILSKNAVTFCLNDNNKLSEKDFEYLKQEVNSIFELRFPEKSKYEKE